MLVSPRLRFRLALVAVGALVLSSMTQAQDLAAVAKKEKERRAKVAKPAKVLTEDDGKEAGAKGAGSVTALAASDTPSAPSTGRPVTSAAETEAQQASWKARADAAHQAVANAEKTLAQMEKDLAIYRSDMTPVSAADAQDPMRLQKRDTRVFEMNKQIEAQKGVVAEAKKAVTAFEEEARRAGVPAGWLR